MVIQPTYFVNANSIEKVEPHGNFDRSYLLTRDLQKMLNIYG